MLRVGGYALAGLPIAFDAVGQLGQEPGNTTGNLAGAAGSALGGLGGGLAGMGLGGMAGAKMGAAGGPWGAAIGFGLGSMLGSSAGGGLLRGTANAVKGLTTDELQKFINQNERLARSQAAMQSEATLAQIPAMQALAALQQGQREAEAQMMTDAQRRMLYQQSMLGPSQVAPGSYYDPNFAASLAAVASGGLS
jgi:hypothetical protein